MTICAQDATVCAKDATVCAKDGTIKDKEARGAEPPVDFQFSEKSTGFPEDFRKIIFGHLSNNRQSSNYFSVVVNNRQRGL